MKPVRADRVRGALLAAWIAALLVPAGAQGAFTVGSPLTASFDLHPTSGQPATIANLALPEPGANVASPISGTIVRWRVTGFSGGPFKLRVLRPGAGNTYTGVGTSAPASPTGLGVHVFPTSVPIQAGDLIAVDINSGDSIGAANVPGASNAFWAPPLADGSTRVLPPLEPNIEIGFNADVEPPNDITLGKVKRNRQRGTATLTVNVPYPGTLDLAGKGVVKQRGGESASASKLVSAAGEVKLRVKAKGKRKRKLNRTGVVKLGLQVTFTPNNGSANTEIRKLKLRKRLR